MTQGNTELRVAENVVTLEGRLIEKKVNDRELDDGRKMLSVDLTIETGKNEQQQVRMFSIDKYQDRQTNEWKDISSYKGLRTVADEYQPSKDVGKEEADLVRIVRNTNPKYPNATFSLNEYYGDQGFVSFPQIDAQRIERIKDKDSINPHAKFEVEAVVAGEPVEETNSDGETGRAILKTYIPINDKGVTRVIPFEFVVGEDGAGYVLDNYGNGDTVSIWGNIVNKRIPKTTVKEGAFGGDKKNTEYISTREYEITGGEEAYDESDGRAYNIDTIKQALQQREVYLENMKDDAAKRKKSGGASKRNAAFSTEPSEKRELPGDDDLPF